MPIVRKVAVHETESVEIEWTMGDGTKHIQRVTVLPRYTRDARGAGAQDTWTDEESDRSQR